MIRLCFMWMYIFLNTFLLISLCKTLLMRKKLLIVALTRQKMYVDMNMDQLKSICSQLELCLKNKSKNNVCGHLTGITHESELHQSEVRFDRSMKTVIHSLLQRCSVICSLEEPWNASRRESASLDSVLYTRLTQSMALVCRPDIHDWS